MFTWKRLTTNLFEVQVLDFPHVRCHSSDESFRRIKRTNCDSISCYTFHATYVITLFPKHAKVLRSFLPQSYSHPKIYTIYYIILYYIILYYIILYYIFIYIYTYIYIIIYILYIYLLYIYIDAQRKTLLVNVSTCVFISIASQIRKNVHITKNTIDVLFNNFKRNLPSTRCK